MGIQLFSINLDNPSGQYSPGQNISGRVYVNVVEEETTTGDHSKIQKDFHVLIIALFTLLFSLPSPEISIRFFGSAYTHWRETEYHTEREGFGKDSKSRTVEKHYYYETNEILFDFAVRLFGDGRNKYAIPLGQNVFPFVFPVPTRPLPVNCKFEDGHVVYGLEGRIRKPLFEFDPKTDILPVTLYTMVDLNITPGAASPMQAIESRSFGCCCPTAPCHLKSFTPKLGYCPGESIPFVVEIINQSNREIYNMRAILTQLWTLFADGYRGRHSHFHSLDLQVAVHPGLGPGQTTRWDALFTVPATIPPSPSPGSCDCIKLEYNISVRACVNGCCGDKEFGLTHPILIGTVPLIPPTVIVTQQTPEYDETGGLA